MSHKLEKGLRKAGVPEAERHLFFCVGPDCCKYREGEALWDYVKHRMKQLGVRAMRTKAGCFRICVDGPLLVIYPDGIWYPKVTPERFERILQEHILGGQPIEEWVIARNALACHAEEAEEPAAARA